MPSVSRAELASRAGSLAAINITPLFLSIHLDFLADALGLPLKIVQEVHKSAGVMTFALMTLHVCLLVDLEVVPGLYVMMVSALGFGAMAAFTDVSGVHLGGSHGASWHDTAQEAST